MKKIKVENKELELIFDKGDCFNEEEFVSKFTDYFYDYDYVLGDYICAKLYTIYYV